MPRVAAKVFLGTALACAGGALALSPGIDVSLSSTGFSFFGTKAVKMAIAGAQTMPLPDIPEQKFSCAGHCYASVSDLAVRSLACGAPSFKYGAARNSVAAAVPACAASASAHYRIHRSTFPSASCSGDVTVSISGFGISGAIDVGESGGALKLSSASVALGVSDIGMHFSGDCKLLADIAKKLIENAIKKQINDHMGSQISAALNKALSSLQIPTSFSGDGLTVDARLPAAPDVSATYFSIPVSGIVSPAAGPPSPVTCTIPAVPVAGSSMLSISVSPCVPDSGLASLASMGKLSFSANRTVLDVPVVLEFKTPRSSPPTFTFSPTPSLHADFNLAVLLPSLNGSLALDVAFTLPATVAVHANKVVTQLGNITLGNIKVSVNSTHGGSGWNPLNGTQWAELLEEIVNEIAVPLVNEKLAAGVAIPTFAGIGIRDAAVAGSNGLLVITADFDAAQGTEDTGPTGQQMVWDDMPDRAAPQPMITADVRSRRTRGVRVSVDRDRD